MKILYVDPYSNTPYSKQYLYYEGLYNALKLNHDVFLYRDCFTDYNNIKNEIPFRPDLILFGLSWFEKHKYFDKIKNLDPYSILILFKPGSELERKLKFCQINNFDLLLTPNIYIYDLLKNLQKKVDLFPYGFDPDIFYPRNFENIYDFGFSGALHAENYYPKGAFKNPNIRQKAQDLINSMKHLKLFWKSTDIFETSRIHDTIEYARTINKSKIWMATQAAYGDITPRYFEVMASGTLLFCEKNPIEYDEIFKNRINCIEFNNSLNDFLSKIKKVINDTNLITKIVTQGINESHEKHTWERRSEQLLDYLE